MAVAVAMVNIVAMTAAMDKRFERTVITETNGAVPDITHPLNYVKMTAGKTGMWEKKKGSALR